MTDPVSGGREVVAGLRALGQYLAGHALQSQYIDDVTIEALHTDAGQRRLETEFEKANLDNLRLHWVDAPELAGPIERGTLAVRVVSAGTQRLPKLYRIDNNHCRPADPEMEPQALAAKQAQVMAWTVADAARDAASSWHDAALDRARAEIVGWTPRFQRGSADRLALDALLAEQPFGWQQVLACYHVGQMDPTGPVAAALAQTRPN